MGSVAEVKEAGRRLSVAALLLAAASAVYYFSDEVPLAYHEVDGYLPVLWIVRLGALIVAMGLLFALVYPLRVVAVRGPLAVRDRRRAAGAPGIHHKALRLERFLDVLLCLAVLGCTYLLVKPALIEALLPLSGVGWAGQVFTLGCTAVGALLVVVLAWLGLAGVRCRRRASSTEGAVASQPPSATPTIVAPAPVPVTDASPLSAPTAETAPTAQRFCGSCGTANSSRAAFCGSCGAGLGASRR